MKTKLAKSAGFCFGVKRAVQTVYDQIKDGHAPIYTFGPIIHNESVVSEFENAGVRVLEGVEDIENVYDGTIIIRSHGISKSVLAKMNKQKQIAEGQGGNVQIVDATCPFVLRIHKYVQEYSQKGYWVIIVGNPSHPEVEGIYGWSDPERTTVIETVNDAEMFSAASYEKICIVAQTTFNINKFQDIVEIFKKKEYDINVLSTICSATEERQKEAFELSGEVDAMVVIGGKSSSNSKKLFEICQQNCLNTYFIQTKNDLDLSELMRFDYVGITAGASTPNNIIEEVQKYVRNEL